LVGVVRQAFFVGPDVRPIRRKLVDRFFGIQNRLLRPGDRRDVVPGRRRIGGVAQVDAHHRKRVPIGVGGDVKRLAVEQADAVERLRGHIVDVGAQGSEFLLVQRAVVGGFCDVLRLHGQFAHARKRRVDLLQVSVLRLAERRGVRDVVGCRMHAAQFGG
jgi:hypothetical protein